MRKPIHITAPPPTSEEWDKYLRIPKTRKKELQALVDEFQAMHSGEAAHQRLIAPEKRRKRASAA